MPPRILVMDDESDTLNMLALTLRLAGYEVKTAETGQQAIALALEYAPDLTILDVMMPDISGIDVLRALKSQMACPPLAVFLSASVRPADKTDGMALGAYTYLVKPVLRGKLLATVRDALLGSAP